MEHVRDAHAVPLRHVANRAQDLRQARARDHAVLHVVRGREPAHRRERALAPRPQPVALERGRRAPQRRRAVRAADLLDPCRGFVETVAQAVDLHEEDPAGVEGIARAHGRFDRFRRELIHQLDRAGHDARADDRRDRL